MLPLNSLVVSSRDPKLQGRIVGYGALQFPDDSLIRPVYLVRIRVGSSSLGPACAVIRADMCEELGG